MNENAPIALAQSRFSMRVATRATPFVAVAAVLVLAALIALPAFAPRPILQQAVLALFLICLAQGWNLLAGYAGLVSVGQQAFVGLGGYILFALVSLGGLDPLLAALLAGIGCAIVAGPIGLVVFRLRGPYFAIVTWVVAEVLRLSFAQWKALGGGTGASLPKSATSGMIGVQWASAMFDVRGPAAREIVIYWAALALAALTIVGVYALLRSRLGLSLFAVRDNEGAAESVGIGATPVKFRIYVISAGIAGFAGALIFLQKGRISPDAAFSVIDWTAYVIFIVVIGGIRTIEGPILGAVLFVIAQAAFADYGAWYLMALGAFGIAMMLIAPGGLWGFAKFDLFPIRRRLIVQPPDATQGGRHA
jgi:branched-chain amino acid transport system permease protein